MIKWSIYFIIFSFIFTYAGWMRTYGWPGLDDEGYSIYETPEGNFVFAASTEEGITVFSLFVCKLNSYGDILISKRYRFSGEFSSLCPKTSGYIIFGGNDLSVVILDTNLTEISDTTWSGSTDGSIRATANSSHNRFAVCGGSRFAYTNANGGPIWTSDVLYPRFAIFTSAGNLLIGKANLPENYRELVQGGAIMLTTSGDTVWEHEYGSTPIRFMGATELSSGDFALVGERGIFSVRDRSKIYILRIDGSGYEEWSRTYGDQMSIYEPRAVATADDGNIVIAASCALFNEPYTKILLLKIDSSDGSTIWERWFGDERGAVVYDMKKTSDGGFVIIGATGGSLFWGSTYCWGQNGEDILVIKTDSDGTLGTFALDDSKPTIELTASPNPFNSFCNVTFSLNKDCNVNLEIVNLSGQIISTLYSGHLNTGEHTMKFEISNEPSGVYFIRLKAGSQSITRRVALVK
ncbi:T9SS type A sorting domain-containing protein [bacterium]|nr:T9SS type A sorting domain-containing protein [bacterium]